MVCAYCGAWNAEDEHRCLRCGRRLGPPPAAPLRSSLAPAREVSRIVEIPERDVQPAHPPQQPDLFRVIPFESIAPPRPAPDQGRRRPPARRNAGRIADPNQGSLSFAAPAAPVSQPVALCQGPVASFGSRVRAGAVDSSMVAAGAILFLLLTRFWESPLPLDRAMLWAPATVLASILCFYKLAFCLLSDRSPGMRAVGLRLMHVSGRPARRRERLVRELASLLSLLTGGIGYLWALADDEGLTFHDHISETFPTAETPPA